MLFMVFFSTFFRIGEAAVPGPPETEPEQTWCLGTINPTGVAGKASLFNQLGEGIYAVAETQLSARGRPRFQAELQASRSKFRMVAGADAPLKYDSLRSIAGAHTGVGFLTTFPVRSIQHGWTTELHTTGRVHAATFQVGNQWVGGGVVYGQACQSNTSATKAHTESLLRELTRQLVIPFPGPAFIAGDFNQEYGTMKEAAEWLKRGWKEAQSWARENLGIPPGPTCKYATRKDFLYLSPVLQQHLKAVSNEFSLFADHSVLKATLSQLSKPVPIPRWRKPKPIVIDKQLGKCVQEMERERVQMPTNPDKAYQMVGEMFETHVDQAKRQLGQPPLLVLQKGRAKTLQRELVHPNVIHVKPSRPGEPAPTMTDWSLVHKQWFTQLRRLISYKNAARHAFPTVKQEQYQIIVWAAITRASGFQPTFVQWWNNQHAEDTSKQLGQERPTFLIAEQMVQAMQVTVGQLETQLKQQRQQENKARRVDNPSIIFQDVRRPRPVPVQTIVAKSIARVEEVVDEATVIVNASQELHPSRPFETNQGSLPVIHVEKEQIWFEVAHHLSQGDVIAQVEQKGTLDEVHEAFLAEWTKRWDRHRHVPIDRWAEVCALATRAFHPRNMNLPEITLAQWKRAIASKKQTAATGMDAISRKDLLSMHDSCHALLLEIFKSVERGQPWPQQLLQGAVNSLEKIPGAASVQEFRPVTVMPLCYRVWSTIRSRQLLHFIVSETSENMHGKPGSNSTNLWWTLQQRIELHLYQGTSAIGIVSDVVKAFNHIPREPVFAIARALGVDQGLLTAWSSATCNLQRHFFVQGSPSRPAKSCTGFVEGCGLSVASMALMNMLIHKYLEHACPNAQFTSYVDNYELEASTIHGAEQALQKLESFCELIDMQLDQKKTYWWAVQAPDRKELRQQQHQPKRAERDLGGHVQYTGQQGNFTVVRRMRDLGDLWPKLAASPAPREQKVRILRTVAWPRGLYGASITHLGANHFEHLRAQTMKAIGNPKAGANPQIQLSLLEAPNVDPEYQVLWDSIVQFRRQGNPEVFEWVAQECIALPTRQLKPGPIGVLLHRLSWIGWQYIGGTQFLDSEHLPVDLLHTCIQELKHRTNRCWGFRVGNLWEHRKDFEGFAEVNAQLSRPGKKHSSDHQGFLRSIMNGTLFTSDFRSHVDETQGRACQWCQHPEDSIQHRHWECEHTKASRDQISADILAMIHTAPACTRTRGWIVEPKSLKQFRRELQQIPDTVDQHDLVDISTHLVVDLFIDGTGLSPGVPVARLVAWGVIVAGATFQDAAQPLSMGGVPGQWQTVHRAELTSLLSAVMYAGKVDKPVRVWGDNQAVIQRAMAIQEGTCQVGNHMSDHDLWVQVRQAIDKAPQCNFQQIRSHQQRVGTPEWQQWAFRHNDLADAEAAQALQALPVQLHQLQKQVSSDVAACAKVREELHQHFIRVGTLAIEEKPAQPTPDSVPKHTEGRTVVDFACVASNAAFVGPARLKFAGVNQVFDWLSTLTNSNEPEVFCSWYELLFAMQISTGIWGFTSTSTHGTWSLMSQGIPYDNGNACRLFACYISRLIRLTYPNFHAEFGRPSSYKFQCWAMGVSLRLSRQHKASVQRWLEAKLGSQQITSVALLNQWEPASMEVEEVSSSSTGLRIGLHRYWT